MRDRGRLVRYCHAHDYGDPGYPSTECADCVFEDDTERAETETENASLRDQVATLTAERDRLRQSAMRLLSAISNAQSEGGAADPLGAFREVQSAEDELEDLIPADVWGAFHAASGAIVGGVGKGVQP